MQKEIPINSDSVKPPQYFHEILLEPTDERPASRDIVNFMTTSHDYQFTNAIRKLVESAMDSVSSIEKDRDCQDYIPLSQLEVDTFYQDTEVGRFMYRSLTVELENQQRQVSNAIHLAVDLQVAFGSMPNEQAARKILQTRSFGNDNLVKTAEFVRQVVQKNSWNIFTILEQNGKTDGDRRFRQKALGLVGSGDEYLLCAEMSPDIMIHPVLLQHLGFSKINIDLIQTEIFLRGISSDVGSIFDFFPRYNDKFYTNLHALIKPGRKLGLQNYQDIIALSPTDIMISGADAHICVAELVDQLEKSIVNGRKVNIWMIHDLITTRPEETSKAAKKLIDLASAKGYIYMINSEQALQLLEKNKKILISGQERKSLSIPDLLMDARANKFSRVLFAKENPGAIGT